VHERRAVMKVAQCSPAKCVPIIVGKCQVFVCDSWDGVHGGRVWVGLRGMVSMVG